MGCSGHHMDTETFKNLTSGHPNILLEISLKCQFQAHHLKFSLHSKYLGITYRHYIFSLIQVNICLWLQCEDVTVYHKVCDCCFQRDIFKNLAITILTQGKISPVGSHEITN